MTQMPVNNETGSFDDFIQEGRKRKKNEDLANEILGKNRRASAPGAGIARRDTPLNGPSLASRMGVSKRPPLLSAKSSPKPLGNVNSKWNHETLSAHHPRTLRVARLPRVSSASHLERGSRLYAELRSDQDKGPSTTFNVKSAAASAGSGINIKGMAGPYTVIASNFAPGTTAADIESVMIPIGGEMTSCRLVASQPTVIAEMLFVDKAGAENVISMFNGKKADGRVLYVYLKDGAPHQFSGASANQPRQFAKPERDIMDIDDGANELQSDKRAPVEYQDGRYGFDERRAWDNKREERRGGQRLNEEPKLFSDRISRPNRNQWRA